MASSRIFVKGLPPNITEADFRKHFGAKGRDVTDVKLIPKRRIGYVGYKTADEAASAVKYFNKTYVRMSKIAVETARPISDSTPKRDTAGHGPSRDPQTRRAETEQLLKNGKDNIAKKRKREDLDESDPKLREYLETMRTGREGIMAEALGAAEAGSAQNDNAAALVPEGESDDEYEQLPSRATKQRKTDDPPQPRGAAAEPAQRDGIASHLETRPETTAANDSGKIQEPGNEQSQAPATDDDWLRSRTNRLLDLVDPDELPTITTTQQNNEKTVETRTTPEPPTDDAGETAHGMVANDTEVEPEASGEGAALDAIRRTSRLFLRNLSYNVTDDDIRDSFERFGRVEEVHLPSSATGTGKGFALVLFADPSDAVAAFQAMDRTTFQGRILHILPASAKRQVGLDEFEISKLPLKKQNLVRKKAEAASNTFNWNALYMNQDAVNTSVANRLGVQKSELLDPTSADAAVKQAIAETSVIQETKSYFAANGVDLNAFKSHKRGDTAILVKNFPYGTTIEELRKLFEESGPVLRVLMPPSGTIAIVQFAQANNAKTAFSKLAYRRIKDSVLFLEKAPRDLLKDVPSAADQRPALAQNGSSGHHDLNVNDLLSHGDKAEEEVDTTSLFVRNLNFATTTSGLAEAFQSLDGFVSARVETKKDTKKPGQTLSMGFGFAEFRTKEQAQAALKVMDGFALDGHTLAVKASHKGLDAAEERRREDKARKAAGQRTKIVIKNLPFQATKKDVRALFGTYGQLRSIRVPKKVDYTSRGFAFADFVTPREAENALNALRDTHLLGRRLVLDFAEAEAVDAEEEIEKMQRKVGGQVNKVALQQLTGGGRKKVNIGDNEEDAEG